MPSITGTAKLTSSSALGYLNCKKNGQKNSFQALENLFRVPDRPTADAVGERPKKKRRLADGKSVGIDNVDTTFDPSQSAKLVQIKLDLVLPDATERFQIPAASRSSVPLSLESFEPSAATTNAFNLSLWDVSTGKNASIEAVVEPELLDQIESHLKIAASLAQTREGRKRSSKPRIPFARCLLHAPSPGQKSLRLVVQVQWALGLSVVERQGAREVTRDDLAILKKYWPSAQADTEQFWALSDFYDAVYIPSTHEDIPARLRESLTDTKLYPFQQRAVNWLLHREGVELSATGEIKTLEPASAATPISFDTVQDAAGQTCYVSHMRGMVVTDPNSVWDATKALRGGILAEEMGLGKTVELIALMSLHRRKMPKGDDFDTFLGADVKPSAATLIISPPSILEQWKNEIVAHAPELKVYQYKGLPPPAAPSKDHQEATAAHLMQFDVVLTTYNVLSKEIHYATPPPDRSLRKAPTRERKKSPLTEIGWWRVCLDEAQMVESGVSQAAKVARIIPRINAWAVSGTPLRKDVQDLRGLLIFLRYEPFASMKVLWDRLDKASFRAIFNSITLRHTKDRIRKELQLPPQKRVIITCPFTTIEEQNYSELIRQMCDACWMTPEGVPTRDDKSADDPEVLERMREWLVRLRQTCLHAHVGKRNRKALGARNGPLRTIHDVLEVMIEQNNTQLKTEAREMMVLQMCRGHIRAFAKNFSNRSRTAIPYYEDALSNAQTYVKMCREELAAAQKSVGLKFSGFGDAMLVDEEGGEERFDSSGRIAAARRALRSFLEVEHACQFFIASSYFQLKDQLMEHPDSAEYTELRVQEEERYDRAKEVRHELLRESQDRALGNMDKTKKMASKNLQDVADLDDLGGIESRKILEMMDRVTETLNKQATHLLEWRKKIVDILTSPLVDQDEGIETTGDEYEASTKVQDELYVYLMALRTLIADRNTAVNGLQDFLVDHELKEAEKKARDDDPDKRGHAPELVLQVAKIRREVQPKTENGSLKGAVSLARSIITNLQWRLDAGDSRAATELAFAENYLNGIQKIATEQAKVVADLEKEQELFRTTMNCRLEFYRQLQHISDSVSPWKENMDEIFDYEQYEQMSVNHAKKVATLKALKTKHTFLCNMRDEGEQEVYLKPECIICQDDFEIGVLTSCGHRYCKECIQTWWHEHRTCPLCKNKLHSRDFKNISFKPTTVTTTEENNDAASPFHPSSPSSAGTSIYSDISDSTMKQIKSIDLDGSYGTKIDMIARHLLWIRNNDRGAKTIIFSQFTDFLDVLRNAFKKWKIGASSIRDKNGIQQFRNDPATECFLLDAKSDSSGLNLVNATYVFLCEPLINPAIELQAIARVHRIGQQRATTVYMYLVSDTVEEAIYDISVSRRLEHMGRNSMPASTSTSMPTSRATSLAPFRSYEDGKMNVDHHETNIDKANSREMEAVPLKQLLRKKGDGEVVSVNDLWKCLFGGKDKTKDKEKDNKCPMAAVAAVAAAAENGANAQQIEAQQQQHQQNLQQQQRQVEEEVDRQVQREVRARAAEERQTQTQTQTQYVDLVDSVRNVGMRDRALGIQTLSERGAMPLIPPPPSSSSGDEDVASTSTIHE